MVLFIGVCADARWRRPSRSDISRQRPRNLGVTEINRRRHVVWDWNGTILGDSEILISSVISAFAATGCSSVTVADHQRHFTRPIVMFFERLAKRALSEGEQRDLRDHFDRAYEEHAADIALTADAQHALATWAAAGHTQSLLSMCPQDVLLSQVEVHGIGRFFNRIDGFRGEGPDTKALHLVEHLNALGPVELEDVVLVGDTVDDALAAREAGVRCLLYHSGEFALEDVRKFQTLDVPILRTLSDVVAHAMR